MAGPLPPAPTPGGGIPFLDQIWQYLQQPTPGLGAPPAQGAPPIPVPPVPLPEPTGGPGPTAVASGAPVVPPPVAAGGGGGSGMVPPLPRPRPPGLGAPAATQAVPDPLQTALAALQKNAATGVQSPAVPNAAMPSTPALPRFGDVQSNLLQILNRAVIPQSGSQVELPSLGRELGRFRG